MSRTSCIPSLTMTKKMMMMTQLSIPSKQWRRSLKKSMEEVGNLVPQQKKKQKEMRIMMSYLVLKELTLKTVQSEGKL